MSWRAGTEAMVEAINVGVRYRRNLRLAEGGQDVGSDLLPIDSLRAGPLAREIVPLEPRSEVGNGCRCSVFLLLADWVGAAINGSLEARGFLACRRGAPIGERADGELTLTTVALAPIVEDEGGAPAAVTRAPKPLTASSQVTLLPRSGAGRLRSRLSVSFISSVPCHHCVITKMGGSWQTMAERVRVCQRISFDVIGISSPLTRKACPHKNLG